MGDYIECRIFKTDVGWADVIFYFPDNISFDEIKVNVRTIHLKKEHYVGKFKFHFTFLSVLDTDSINNKSYYFTYFIPRGIK